MNETDGNKSTFVYILITYLHVHRYVHWTARKERGKVIGRFENVYKQNIRQITQSHKWMDGQRWWIDTHLFKKREI
jgi:hypothetical protein